MTTTFKPNPVVKEIFEAAVKAAHPVWLAVTCDGAEVTERCQVYFAPGDAPQFYYNASAVGYVCEMAQTFNGVTLSKTKTSAPFVLGALDRERKCPSGDTLMFPEASIVVWGPVTKEFSS